MGVTLCEFASQSLIAFHRRLPSRTLLSDVECGRAQVRGELQNRHRRGLYQYTRINEPVCVPADQLVVAVTAPPVGPGDVEALL